MNPQIIQDQINGFSRIEYLSIFITFLYAAATSEYLVGWGKILRNKKEFTAGVEYILWTITLFLVLIINWYAMWPRLAFPQKGFVYFAIVFAPIILFYFLSVSLFPDMNKTSDLKNHFESNSSLIILLFTIYMALQNIISIFLDGYSFFSFEILGRIGVIILGAIYIASKSRKWRYALLAISDALLLVPVLYYSK